MPINQNGFLWKLTFFSFSLTLAQWYFRWDEIVVWWSSIEAKKNKIENETILSSSRWWDQFENTQKTIKLCMIHNLMMNLQWVSFETIKDQTCLMGFFLSNNYHDGNQRRV